MRMLHIAVFMRVCARYRKCICIAHGSRSSSLCYDQRHHAARLLGMTPRQIAYRIQTLAIEVKQF
jgi:hypothetical protein